MQALRWSNDNHCYAGQNSLPKTEIVFRQYRLSSQEEYPLCKSRLTMQNEIYQP